MYRVPLWLNLALRCVSSFHLQFGFNVALRPPSECSGCACKSLNEVDFPTVFKSNPGKGWVIPYSVHIRLYGICLVFGYHFSRKIPGPVEIFYQNFLDQAIFFNLKFLYPCYESLSSRTFPIHKPPTTIGLCM